MNEVLGESAPSALLWLKPTVDTPETLAKNAILSPLLSKCGSIVDEFWRIEQIDASHIADLKKLSRALQKKKGNSVETVVKRTSCWTRRLHNLELNAHCMLKDHMAYVTRFEHWIEEGGDMIVLKDALSPQIPLEEYSWDDISLTAEQRFFRIVTITFKQYWQFKIGSTS